jgi:DNA repair exonuclease SbcCD ATPase subunit
MSEETHETMTNADELAELQAELEGAEGDEPTPAPPEAPKAEPKREEPEPPKERYGEGWKKLRKARSELDRREAALAAREAEIQAKLQAAEKKAALVDRLAKKDLDALGEVGLSVDDLVAAEIERQRGGGPAPKKADLSPLEAKIKELEDRLRSREDQEQAARVEREAVQRFEGAISKEKTPLLSKMPPEKRVALGGALAKEFHDAGQRVPLPEEIVPLLERRLREEYEAMRALVEDGEEKPLARSAGPSTISRNDTKARPPTKGSVPTADEEMAELQALLRG